MAEVYRPLGLHNYLLSYVINGALSAAKTQDRAVFIIKTLVLLLTALGFFLSWDKCQFTPVQHSKFLGLIVDSRDCRLFVPADKMVYIRHMIAKLLGVHAYAYRRLASVAGMLMSVSAAEYTAPLYIRKLYQSMGGNMDDDIGNPALAREDLQYWCDNIKLCVARLG